ncbi:hypothetical protein BJ508DRAFT_335325 [Ascobolus immersus RN42]|uniref:Uncharacterized protein n=1 Tax=Ascobolus immersus RN42 TaxID=1160509 RepID=A0A3N4HCT5_ASCIM|nr:hypothetical protein BJ508DRAFT_335325 [Ascobolus immersus RN42]
MDFSFSLNTFSLLSPARSITPTSDYVTCIESLSDDGSNSEAETVRLSDSEEVEVDETMEYWRDEEDGAMSEGRADSERISSHRMRLVENLIRRLAAYASEKKQMGFLWTFANNMKRYDKAPCEDSGLNELIRTITKKMEATFVAMEDDDDTLTDIDYNSRMGHPREVTEELSECTDTKYWGMSLDGASNFSMDPDGPAALYINNRPPTRPATIVSWASGRSPSIASSQMDPPTAVPPNSVADSPEPPPQIVPDPNDRPLLSPLPTPPPRICEDATLMSDYPLTPTNTGPVLFAEGPYMEAALRINHPGALEAQEPVQFCHRQHIRPGLESFDYTLLEHYHWGFNAHLYCPFANAPRVLSTYPPPANIAVFRVDCKVRLGIWQRDDEEVPLEDRRRARRRATKFFEREVLNLAAQRGYSAIRDASELGGTEWVALLQEVTHTLHFNKAVALHIRRFEPVRIGDGTVLSLRMFYRKKRYYWHPLDFLLQDLFERKRLKMLEEWRVAVPTRSFLGSFVTEGPASSPNWINREVCPPDGLDEQRRAMQDTSPSWFIHWARRHHGRTFS